MNIIARMNRMMNLEPDRHKRMQMLAVIRDTVRRMEQLQWEDQQNQEER